MREPFVRKEPEYKFGDLPQKSLYIKVLGNLIEVLRNPSEVDYSSLKRDSVRRFGEPRHHDVKLRSKQDNDGNSYYWVAGDGIHATVDPVLMATIEKDK